MQPSASSTSKKDGLKFMLEEDDRVENADLDEEDYGEEVELPQPFDLNNKSTESFGSQLSTWDGDEDFGALMMAYNTQPADEPPPPSSLSTSGSRSSLGKRKASDMSSTSSIVPTKDPKCARPEGFATTDDNPFVSKPGDKSTESLVEEDLNFTPICFSPPSHTQQKIFATHKLPYGVQYEIARQVCLDKFQYRDIYIPNLIRLAKIGNCKDAILPGMIQSIMENPSVEVNDNNSAGKDAGLWQNAFAKERASKSPWEELDREEKALLDNPKGGLGFNEAGEYLNWYGGKVLFHGKLQDTSAKGTSKPSFKMTLEPAELGPSNMFARRFGSKHFFRLKLTKSALNTATKNSQPLLDYLRRPLILCGNVFRAFYTKETNAFYVKTNEVVQGDQILEGETIPGAMSFLDFLAFHNLITLNNKQTMAKYVSRFHLGLSNSVPGIVLKQENIRFIDDIISPEGSNMTDGAGKINRWSLMQIRHRLNWEDRPTAIQMRVFGTKGLLIDDGKCAEEYAYVEVTPSQRKILFAEDQPADLAHRIIDVLRASHIKAPCRLSVETIICLAENGVGKHVFFELLQKGLKELVEPLLEWNSQEDMRKLWCNVRRLGGVMAARRAREDVGLARVKGYSEKDAEEEMDDEDGIDNTASEQDSSLPWWGDEISGSPSSLAETIMYMLDSGFTPQECPVLRDKLHKFIKGRVAHYIKSYRIDVPMSASAFMIPDTSGKLKPGQLFFKSSRREFLAPDGSTTDIITGDVLVTRHPCKLPTDIQKMQCVDIPELHNLVDVIVFSTQGSRRGADLLSGGDHDGDKAIYIFQPEIVKAFKNANLSFSEPPKDINENFQRENMEVTAFLKKIEKFSEGEKIRTFQEYLLGSIRNMSVVGKYSTFHDIATYTLGYSHPETIRLAYMFCMTLDGIKSGMTVLKTVLDKDTHRFQKRSPVWKETEEERLRVEANNETHTKRPSRLGRFIMDDLYNQAKGEGNTWFAKLDQAFDLHTASKLDEDLAAPWRKALEEAKRWQAEENNSRRMDDLKKIQTHVEAIFRDHRGEMASPRKTSKNTPKKNGVSFTDLPIEVRQNRIRDLSLKFNSSPSTAQLLMSEEEILRIRASYAYLYDFEQKNGYTSRFPFDVAMRELCAIKVRALGHFKPVCGDFYDHFNMKHPNQHHH